MSCRDVLKKAMYAFESGSYAAQTAAIAAIEAELAKPEQEPVAVFELQHAGWEVVCDGDWIRTLPMGTKLYTAPPQRQPIRREQRMCPNTYYECGRGCGDGPCKDFDAAYDIKEKS